MNRFLPYRWLFILFLLGQLAACSMTPAPLHSFIKSDQQQKALELIAERSTVNARDQMGYTPLHLAAIKGNSTITEALIRQNVDLNARDFHGRTPFMLALREGHDDLAAYLLDQGAQLDTNYTLTNPLFDAVSGNNIEMTDYLIQRGFSVNSVNRRNSTALHIAATHGDNDMIALLIRHGIDVNRADHDGWTALHFAGARQHRDSVRLLLSSAAKPVSLDTDALAAYGSGVVYEEVAKADSNRPESKQTYLSAAEHFATAAAHYKKLGSSVQKRIEEQHAKNAFALALGAFALAIQPGTPMPTSSGGTVHLYTPIVVPQGSVTSLQGAQAAYQQAELDALDSEKRCREAAASL